jgi:outer membrane protein assembly factor BamD (BamD/ComL family)
MGRKPVGQGQYFYFCLALLIFFAGCSTLQESTRSQEMREALTTGQHLLAHGDYDGSLKAFQDVVVMAQDQPPADTATYNIGLVYAHPQNSRRDLQKAIGSFSRLITHYPESPWTEQAKIWVGVLNEAEESKQAVEDSKQVIEKSREEVEKNRLAVEKSKEEIEKTRLELEKSKQEIEKTKQVIEKYKQVDIEIEQKRRDRGR